MTGQSDLDDSPRRQLEQAVKDLWSMVRDAGDDYVIFVDRRRMATRVERTDSGSYRVSWEHDDGTWHTFKRQFENPREAAFHAFQGPH